ncbi:MAG: hypothetical protein ABI137_15535 [Antricoccus sp.]
MSTKRLARTTNLQTTTCLRGRTRLRSAGIAAWLLSAILIFVVPSGFRPLAAIGYTPIVIVKALLGSWPWDYFFRVWTLPTTSEVLGIGVGVVLAVFGGRIWSRTRATGMSTDGIIRLGRIATLIAVVCPLVYATTRYAWALGIPLGLATEFLQQIQPIVLNGLGLAIAATLGAILTIGLVRPWGEVFPRWLPILSGHRVPIGLAVNFAIVVSALVASAGASFLKQIATGEISDAPAGAIHEIGAWLPETLWIPWAAALATAALCYRIRRQQNPQGQSLRTAGHVRST